MLANQQSKQVTEELQCCKLRSHVQFFTVVCWRVLDCGELMLIQQQLEHFSCGAFQFVRKILQWNFSDYLVLVTHSG
jgi:hypothetical protein